MKQFLGIVMAGTIIASLVGCDKKEDSSKKTLLLLILDQMSGNCALISKNTTGTVYSAQGNKLPKAVCKDLATYTLDVSVIKAANDKMWNGLIAVLTSSNCTAVATQSASYRDAATTTLLTTLTNGSPSKCMTGGDTKAPVTYCIAQSNIDAYKASFQYYVTGDVATDMSTNLQSNITAKTGAAQTVTKFTTAAVNALTPVDQAFTSATTTPAGTVVGLAYIPLPGFTAACAKDLLTADAILKAQYARLIGSNAAYGITDADAAAVNSVIVQSITCGYGSGFTATSTNGPCPSKYPTW